MGVLKSAADLIYTVRFLKLLVTPFTETEAFKSGIIDEKGNKRRDFNTNTIDDRNAYREHYTPFHRLVFNLKKIIEKAPGGSSRIASYAAALFLIKESGNLSNKNLEKIHNETGIDVLDILTETSQWFIIKENQLSPGTYRMLNDSITTRCEEVVMKGDKITISEKASIPVGEVFGVYIYQVTHQKSNQNLYVTTGEITR